MATQTQEKKLSLKPIEKALEEILRELVRVEKRRDLQPAQRKLLEKDIKNVKKLLKEIPPMCHTHTPPYNFRY
jgi:RNA polymerase-interacting CarD/CdnL/TRCF family regulator